MATLSIFPPPPIDKSPFPGRVGVFSIAWQRWFLAIGRALATSIAPSDATYVLSKANAALTNAINLGALASGYLRVTVTLGIAAIASIQVLSSQLEPISDVTIPANESTIVADRFVLALGKTLTIGAGAVFQVT